MKAKPVSGVAKNVSAASSPGKNVSKNSTRVHRRGNNIGSRTGLDIKAGKNIRRDKSGREVFEDYWTESEAENTLNLDQDLHVPPPVQIQGPGKRTQANNGPSRRNVSGISSLSQKSRHAIGSRTGVDVKAGKNIRKDKKGLDVFEDYWTDSEVESTLNLDLEASVLNSVSKAVKETQVKAHQDTPSPHQANGDNDDEQQMPVNTSKETPVPTSICSNQTSGGSVVKRVTNSNNNSVKEGAKSYEGPEEIASSEDHTVCMGGQVSSQIGLVSTEDKTVESIHDHGDLQSTTSKSSRHKPRGKLSSGTKDTEIVVGEKKSQGQSGKRRKQKVVEKSVQKDAGTAERPDVQNGTFSKGSAESPNKTSPKRTTSTQRNKRRVNLSSDKASPVTLTSSECETEGSLSPAFEASHSRSGIGDAITSETKEVSAPGVETETRGDNVVENGSLESEEEQPTLHLSDCTEDEEAIMAKGADNQQIPDVLVAEDSQFTIHAVGDMNSERHPKERLEAKESVFSSPPKSSKHTTLNINGEATGSWTKSVHVGEDLTLTTPLKSFRTRKRLSYSAGDTFIEDSTSELSKQELTLSRRFSHGDINVKQSRKVTLAKNLAGKKESQSNDVLKPDRSVKRCAETKQATQMMASQGRKGKGKKNKEPQAGVQAAEDAAVSPTVVEEPINQERKTRGRRKGNAKTHDLNGSVGGQTAATEKKSGQSEKTQDTTAGSENTAQPCAAAKAVTRMCTRSASRGRNVKQASNAELPRRDSTSRQESESKVVLKSVDQVCGSPEEGEVLHVNGVSPSEDDKDRVVNKSVNLKKDVLATNTANEKSCVLSDVDSEIPNRSPRLGEPKKNRSRKSPSNNSPDSVKKPRPSPETKNSVKLFEANISKLKGKALKKARKNRSKPNCSDSDLESNVRFMSLCKSAREDLNHSQNELVSSSAANKPQLLDNEKNSSHKSSENTNSDPDVVDSCNNIDVSAGMNAETAHIEAELSSSRNIWDDLGVGEEANTDSSVDCSRSKSDSAGDTSTRVDEVVSVTEEESRKSVFPIHPPVVPIIIATRKKNRSPKNTKEKVGVGAAVNIAETTHGTKSPKRRESSHPSAETPFKRLSTDDELVENTDDTELKDTASKTPVSVRREKDRLKRQSSSPSTPMGHVTAVINAVANAVYTPANTFHPGWEKPILEDFDQINGEGMADVDQKLMFPASGPCFRPKRQRTVDINLDEDSEEESSGEESCEEEGDVTLKAPAEEEGLIIEAETSTRKRASFTRTPQSTPRRLSRLKQTRRSHGKKRVTISSFILPSPKLRRPSSGVPTTLRKSILKTPGSSHVTPVSRNRSCISTPGIGSAEVAHIWEVTHSETPQIPQHRPEGNKIIFPEPAPDGLRRSKRTRLKPLQWYKHERARYDKRKSGGFIIVDVSPPHEEPKRSKKTKLARKLQQIKRQRADELKQRRLSTHVNLPIDPSLIEEGNNIVVRDHNSPTKETSCKCLGPQSSSVYWGPSGQEVDACDPYILCKNFQEATFSAGELILRPAAEKQTQYVSGSTMVFYIIEGKLAVTIHETTSILQTRDCFYVPPENTYSLKNLRNSSAKLFFTQVKGTESSSVSHSE